jgi:Mg2+/Co2+ transporter CorB
MMAANKIKLKNLSKKPDRGAKRALNFLKNLIYCLQLFVVNNFANILAHQ